LLSKHPIEGLDQIVYTDTIEVNSQPVERTWRVTWTKKFGPPTQSTSETFFALFQIWAESGFSTPWIHFRSMRAILGRRGVQSFGRHHIARVQRDLHVLTSMYIDAKNAFYDSAQRKYIDAGFHLFETLVVQKNSPGSPDPSSRGFIQASEILHAAAQRNAFPLGVAEHDFYKLPGIQQRLYLYLKKMLTFQKVHVRAVSALAQQMPLFTVESYRVKQQLKDATQAILDAELINQFADFTFYTNNAGVELMRFERSDSKQTDLFTSGPGASPDDHVLAESNFQLITATCLDTHSYPFYRIVAAKMSTDDILRALSEAKAFASEVHKQGRPCSLPKVFTSRINSLAIERGVELRT
jgi:hypothetical protein